MVVDLAGKTVAVAENRLVVGTVRSISGNVATIVTLSGQVVRVDARKTLLPADLAVLSDPGNDGDVLMYDAVDAEAWIQAAAGTTLHDRMFGAGGMTRRHRHPAWTDDFMDYAGGRWKTYVAGSGNAFVQDPLTYGAPLDTDAGDGYMRLTNGATAGAGNSVAFCPAQNTHWPNFLTSAARRYRVRVLLSHTTSIKASCGIARVSAGAHVPAPSIVCTFDSADTNVWVRWNDGAGNTGNVDTGTSLASFGTSGHWLEFMGGASSITVKLDGLTVATWSTNLPTGNNRGLAPYAYLDGNGVTWRGLFLDYSEWVPATARFTSILA